MIEEAWEAKYSGGIGGGDIGAGVAGEGAEELFGEGESEAGDAPDDLKFGWGSIDDVVGGWEVGSEEESRESGGAVVVEVEVDVAYVLDVAFVAIAGRGAEGVHRAVNLEVLGVFEAEPVVPAVGGDVEGEGDALDGFRGVFVDEGESERVVGVEELAEVLGVEGGHKRVRVPIVLIGQDARFIEVEARVQRARAGEG